MKPMAETMKKSGHRIRYKGFSLVEVMISITLGLILMIAIVSIFSGIRAGQNIQDGLTHVQEDGRIAIQLMSRELRNAGYRKPVWIEPQIGYFPITNGSLEGASGANDTLQLMYQDDSNCRGVLNGNIDPETGETEMGYKRITFAVDDNENLVWSCDYGLTTTNLVAGFTNQDVIAGVESFQLLIGIDTDFPPDFSVNSWTTADAIEPRTSVCLQSQTLCEGQGLLDDMAGGIPVAMKIGLLVASTENVDTQADTRSFSVLDVVVPSVNDRKMRKTFVATVNMRNLTL